MDNMGLIVRTSSTVIIPGSVNHIESCIIRCLHYRPHTKQRKILSHVHFLLCQVFSYSVNILFKFPLVQIDILPLMKMKMPNRVPIKCCIGHSRDNMGLIVRTSSTVSLDKDTTLIMDPLVVV